MDSTGSVVAADATIPVAALKRPTTQHVIVRTGFLLLICVLVALIFQWNRIIPLNGAWGWGGDEGQMIWNLWVVNWNAIHGHNPLITRQIFYPHHTNLTHHSLASGYLPLTFITYLIYGHDPRYPLVALRLGTWLCYALTLMLTYLVLRHLGYRRIEAAIPAVGFAFCGFNEHHLHLTVLSGWFIPLDALMVLRWWSKPTWQRMCAATFCFAVGVYFTEYSAFCALALLLACIILCCRRRGRRALIERFRATGWAGMAAAFGLALAVAAPFIINFVRADPVILPDFAEHEFNSSDLLGIFIPTREWGFEPAILLYGHLFDRFNTVLYTESETFIGFPLILLSLIGMLSWRRNPRIVRGAAVMAFVFYVLMLGPRLRVLGYHTGIHLPYSLLIPIPPFNVQRAPLRLVVFLIFFLTIVGAQGAATIRGWFARETSIAGQRSTQMWRKYGGAALLVAILGWIVAESYNPHTAFPSYQPPPQVAQLMVPAGKPLTPLAALPIDPSDGYSEMLQIYHHRPHITGYLARWTTKQLQIFASLERAYLQGPQPFAERLKRNGVDTVAVYWDALDNVYSPSNIFLADLAREVKIVDFRPEQRLVAEAGCTTLINGQPWDAPGTLHVQFNRGIVLRCNKPAISDRIEFLAQSNAIFDIELMAHGQTVRSVKAMPVDELPMTLQWRCFKFPETSVDGFRITLRAGPGDVTIGRIAVWAK